MQLPNLASIYGAMLADVDFVLMGAGIPTQVAAILDRFSDHQPNTSRLDVRNSGPQEDIRIAFDPEGTFPGISKIAGKLKRPRFLPIISSVALAQALVKRSEGARNGFVIEGPTAGGHNAPPRGQLHLNENGEPIYGDKDLVNLAKMKELGLPFWLAGGQGPPLQLNRALKEGATGVQVRTPFSLCDESGWKQGSNVGYSINCWSKEFRSSPPDRLPGRFSFSGRPCPRHDRRPQCLRGAETHLRPQFPSFDLHARGRPDRLSLSRRTG